MATLTATKIVYGSSLTSANHNQGLIDIENWLNGVTASADMTITGAMTAASYASSGNITINTNKFTVAGATGNTVVAGTLGVTGNVRLGTQAIKNTTSLTLQLGIGNILFYDGADATGNVMLNHNAYYASGYKAYATGMASQILQTNGYIKLNVSNGSVSADATVTWVTALTINNDSTVSIASTTDSSSTTTGSLITAGGLGVAKRSSFGDRMTIDYSSTLRALQITSSNSNAYGIYINLSGNAGAGKEAFQIDNSGGNVFKVLDTGSVYTSGDIYTTAWTNYSSTSTIVGWSSFTYKVLDYKKVGKTVFVNFRFEGTSNSATTTFTLPVASRNEANVVFLSTGLAVDNGGTAVAARIQVSTASTTVTLYSTMSASSWTASGFKAMYGQFFYETD